VVKLLVGLLKGAVIGGALGYGAYALGQSTGFSSAWLTYGLVGVLVGLLVGKPIWSLIRDKSSTTVVAILKAAFGFGVGCGLYALLAKVWDPSFKIEIAGQNMLTWSPTVGGAIGAVYGAFIELDDSIGDDGGGKKPVDPEPAKKPAATKPEKPGK
jgi:hypothetical protein